MITEAHPTLICVMVDFVVEGRVGWARTKPLHMTFEVARQRMN